MMCLLSLVHAQAEPPAENLTVSFSIFPLNAGDWSKIVFAPDGNVQNGVEPLIFNRLERSFNFDYDGPHPLVFYKERTNEEGLLYFEPFASPTLPPGTWEHPVILFFEFEEKGKGPTTIKVMMDSDETFPDESLVIFNTMPFPLRGALGEAPIEIPPGLSKPIEVSQFFGSQIPIIMALEHEGDLHLVLRNKMSFFPERRTLLILRKPSRPSSLRIRTQRLTEMTKDQREEELPPEEDDD